MKKTYIILYCGIIKKKRQMDFKLDYMDISALLNLMGYDWKDFYEDEEQFLENLNETLIYNFIQNKVN